MVSISIFIFGSLIFHGGFTLHTMKLNYDPNDAIRPSGSSGGLVDGIDRYVIEATVTIDPTDKWRYAEDSIAVRVRDPGRLRLWRQILGCRLAGCPHTDHSGCYCKSFTSTDYNLVINNTADIQYSGFLLQLNWPGSSISYQEIASNSITLPDVCGQIESRYTTEGTTSTPVENINNTVKKVSDSTSLTFTVTGLEGTYDIKITHPTGTAVHNSSTSVTTTVSNDEVGQVFEMSYYENGLTPGCGRSKLYRLVYSAGDDDDDNDFPWWWIVGAIICAFALGFVAIGLSAAILSMAG